jgi:hypothetical protein
LDKFNTYQLKARKVVLAGFFLSYEYRTDC